MVMDCARMAYKRRCRFYLGDDREVFIVWYVAAPGAKHFEEEHCFFQYNQLRGLPNIPGDCGELTDFRIRYYNGKPPFPDIAGDHYEGSLDDFMGRTRVMRKPDGAYYVPVVGPRCTVRPALGLLCQERNPATVTRSLMGIFGRNALHCPPSDAAFGLLSFTVPVVPAVARLGIFGGAVPSEPTVSRLGIFGGEVCGPPPALSYSGRVAAPVAPEILLTGGGTVQGPARLGGVDAAVAYAVSAEASGSVVVLDLGGNADGVADYSLDLAGTGFVGPPAFVGFTGLFGSGLDALGHKQVGSCPEEQHWLMNGVPPQNPAVGAAGWVGNGSSAYSRWMSPDCTDTHPLGAGGVFTYSLTFTVDLGLIVPGDVLHGREASDDNVIECRVNGVATGYTSTSSWVGWSSFYLSTALLVDGANTIEFDVQDAVAVNWTGFRCEFLALVGRSTGSLDAPVDCGITLASSGSVAALDLAGGLDAAVDYSVSLAATGSVVGPDRAGSLDGVITWDLLLAGSGSRTGPPFSPAVTADIVFALWAPALVGFANADPIGTAPSLLSLGDFTAAGGVRPSYRSTAGPSSLPIMRFDGSDDLLGSSFSLNMTPCTVVWVAKATPGSVPWGGLGNAFIFNWSGGNAEAFAGASLTFAINTAIWNIVTVVFDGATSVVRVNGVETSGDTSGATNVGNSVGLGGWPNSLIYRCAQDCLAFMGWSRVLDATERAAMEAQINAEASIF